MGEAPRSGCSSGCASRSAPLRGAFAARCARGRAGEVGGVRRRFGRALAALVQLLAALVSRLGPRLAALSSAACAGERWRERPR